MNSDPMNGMSPSDMLRLNRTDADVVLADRGADLKSREFWGTATTYCSINSYFFIIAPNSLTASFESFLARGYIGGLNHNDDQPIGAPIEVRNDGHKLYLKADLAPGLAHADEVLAMMTAKVGRDKRQIGRAHV